MSNGKAMTKKQNNELAHLVETDEKMMGTDNIDQSDIIMPRIKIVQGQTKEKSEHPEVKDGYFFNSVTWRSFEKKIIFVPFAHWKTCRMFNKQLETVCMSADSIVNTDGNSCTDCGKNKFKKVEGKNIKPECNLINNYLIAEINELKEAVKNKKTIEPVVISFMSTATKVAKKINSCIKVNAGRQFPIYSACFILTTPDKPTEFETGAAYIPDVKIGDFVTEVEYEYLKKLFKAFRKIQIKTEITEDEIKVESDEV